MNHHGFVTLDEVFAAATARAASLVPETSGYLALALGDATSRLPLAPDDRAVMLTTEGTVSVTRRGDPVSPRQAARTLRGVLARLLAASAGTMPGLAGAARAREESDRGVDAVVEEIEAALIPVNRAAARRALARLARETLRARELGKLTAPRLEREEGERDEREETPALASPNPVLVLAAAEPAPAMAFREVTPTALGMPPVEPVDALQSEGIDLGAPTEIDVVTDLDLSPSPSRTIPLPRRPPGGVEAPARPACASPSRADDLLARFGVSCDGEISMRETAACLKKFAGIDPTPPVPSSAPPRVVLALPASHPPAATLEDRFFRGERGADAAPLLELPLPAPRRPRPALGALGALLLGALASAFLVARVRPDLLASITARLATPSAAHTEAPAR